MERHCEERRRRSICHFPAPWLGCILRRACLNDRTHASTSLIVAALLHDIGHLLEAVPDDIADWATDVHHEEAGGRWLAQRLRAQVAEPVRLHVAAKRYLCATDANYFALLSPASVKTLRLQGGPMSPAEQLQFETQPYYQDAVRIRRWDDLGKIAGLTTPNLCEYRELIDGFALKD
jgi:predicted HD phosphohydrolase